MANHKSSKKRIRQTAAKSTAQHLGEECRRSPASQGNHHAGQARQAQYRAQEQGRKPEERPPVARERTLNPGRMQSQKLPLWQLFLFPCAKQRYQPPSRQPKYSAHIRSGIPPVRQSRPHRCGRLPFFSAGASLRGTTLPGDPPDPPAASLLPGKPGSVPGITPFLESLGP